MIFDSPPPDAPVDQGDIIDGCPLLYLESFDLATLLAEREHLARHFAETYARIGLPQPYETRPQ